MGEGFFRQTRRFPAGGLTPGKGNRRSMAEKDPPRRRPTAVNTGSKQKRSLAALIVSLLPLATLVPVFLKITLPDGVRTVWAACNIALAPAGLLLSLVCVKSEKSRSAANILSTIISMALVLMMLGLVALALVLGFLQE